MAERTVYLNGSTEQIEAAKELVNDVISGVSHVGNTFDSHLLLTACASKRSKYF